MKKRILGLLVALCLVVSMVPVAFAAGAEQYNDIPAGSWYTQYVDAVTSAGYFEGYGNGRFAPTDKMTRAMFVTVMSRMDGATVDNTVSQFPDVPANMWYTGAVTWAQTNNIVKGRNETTFAPNDPITRAEMSIIMNRFVNYYAAKTNKVPETTSREINFSDIADLNEEYTSSIKSCVSYGLIEGYPDGTFKPSASATRAEVAAVVSRLAWKTTGFNPGGPGGTTPTTPPPTSTPSEEPTTYTVTYKFNNDTLTKEPATAGKPYTVLTWEAIKGSHEPEDGMAFASWVDKDENAYSEGAQITVTDDLTLTAHFVNTKDLLFFAMKNAAEGANKWYDEYRESVKDVHGIGTYVDAMFENFGINDKEDPEGEKTRPQTVTGSAIINGETVGEKIITFAAETASAFLTSGEVNTDSLRTDVETLVKEIAEALGVKDIDDATLRQIASAVYKKVASDGGQILKDAKFNEAATSVKVTVDGKSVTVNFTESGISLSGTTKKQAARTLGVALANALYTSVQKSNPTYTSGIQAKATIGLEFEVQKNKGLDDFPNKYPFTVNLTFSDPDGVLSYQYKDNTNYVKVTLTEKLQTKYADEVKGIVEQIMTGENFAGQLDEMKTYMEGDQGPFKGVVDALAKFSGKEDEAKETVNGFIDDWFDINFNSEDLTQNVFYKNWTKGGDLDALAALLDNDDLTGTSSVPDDGIINTVATEAGAYFTSKIDEMREKEEDPDKLALFNGIIDGAMGTCKPETFEVVLKMFLETDGFDKDVNFDTLASLPEGIRFYIYASIIDEYNGTHTHRSAKYDGMVEAVGKLIEEKLDDKLKEGGLDTLLKTLTNIRNVETLVDVKFGDLKALLNNDVVTGGSSEGGDALASLKDQVGNYVKRLANAAANRNATVKFELKDGTHVTLDNAALKKIASKSGAEALTELVNALSTLKPGEWTLGSFTEDWLTITVTTNAKTEAFQKIVVCPVIEVK